MAERATFIDDGIDRVQTMFKSVEDEFQKLQKQTVKRRKDLEKKAQKRRKDFEKKAQQRRREWEKQTKKLEKDIRSNTVVKKAEAIRVDVSKQIEEAVDQMLGWLPFATQSDLTRLDRKLNQINRKLRALEKNGGAKPKAAPRRSASQSAQ